MVLRLMAQRNFIFVICPSVRERAPRFRFEAFKDVLLPVPPIAEQRAMMSLIAGVSDESTALTSEATRVIDLLEERRTALISAAVTGQIDVRPHAKTS
jgi:type I restriction enzyme S subunit